MSNDISIVIHRFIINIILTVFFGSQSKSMVLKSMRNVKLITIVMMDSVIARRPDIMEPFRRDWQKQQVFVSGLDIFARASLYFCALGFICNFSLGFSSSFHNSPTICFLYLNCCYFAQLLYY